ncbi:predicted protein [Nematostella vectensis]|uniref:Uncharacterized protein n=1 Tax=Nematostella vectensis TaxID=45351 RepID=A7RZ02_NEMVE|nr:predicted protein [Nematostella vectensis]|eukprot:XP_001635339.1 predicted protein [Nematostella vectensis]
MADHLHLEGVNLSKKPSSYMERKKTSLRKPFLFTRGIEDQSNVQMQIRVCNNSNLNKINSTECDPNAAIKTLSNEDVFVDVDLRENNTTQANDNSEKKRGVIAFQKLKLPHPSEHAHKCARELPVGERIEGSRGRSRSNTILLLSLLVVFVLCYALALVNVGCSFTSMCKRLRRAGMKLKAATLMMELLNVLINPVLVTMLTKDLRKTAVRVWKNIFPCKKTQDSPGRVIAKVIQKAGNPGHTEKELGTRSPVASSSRDNPPLLEGELATIEALFNAKDLEKAPLGPLAAGSSSTTPDDKAEANIKILESMLGHYQGSIIEARNYLSYLKFLAVKGTRFQTRAILAFDQDYRATRRRENFPWGSNLDDLSAQYFDAAVALKPVNTGFSRPFDKRNPPSSECSRPSHRATGARLGQHQPPGQGLVSINHRGKAWSASTTGARLGQHQPPGQGLVSINHRGKAWSASTTGARLGQHQPLGQGLVSINHRGKAWSASTTGARLGQHQPPGQGLFSINHRGKAWSASTTGARLGQHQPPGQGLVGINHRGKAWSASTTGARLVQHQPLGQGLVSINHWGKAWSASTTGARLGQHQPPGQGLVSINHWGKAWSASTTGARLGQHQPPGQGLFSINHRGKACSASTTGARLVQHQPPGQGLVSINHWGKAWSASTTGARLGQHQPLGLIATRSE